MKRLAMVLFLVGFLQILCAQNCKFSNLDRVQVATFGNMSEVSCVDDDFSQTIFITIPENFSGSFYIRVFDPDCGGEHDLSLGVWETNTSFEVYGGAGCISDSDARDLDPGGNYKSGILLAEELFAEESAVDGSWVSFGPFNTQQGESLDEFEAYRFFKLLVEGNTGNDGNMYEVCVSKDEDKNTAIEHASLFFYELTYLNTESNKLNRMESTVAMREGINLPIELTPIEIPEDYNLIAVPIEE